MRQEKKFEKKFWGKLNEICIKCSKTCKQSAKVKILECPSFEKADKKEVKKNIDSMTKSRWGHRLSSVSGKIDKLIDEGQNMKQICMLLHITEARLKGHLRHLNKDHGFIPWK